MTSEQGTRRIDVAAEFTKELGPRYRELGPFSGEAFREDILEPAIREHQRVVVDLDGVTGYGSSFLEEVFGGVIRTFGASTIENKLEVKSMTRPWLLERIEGYIEDAIRHESDPPT